MHRFSFQTTHFATFNKQKDYFLLEIYSLHAIADTRQHFIGNGT